MQLHSSTFSQQEEKKQDDDWSRYADDPDNAMIRLKSREERRRLGRVSAVTTKQREEDDRQDLHQRAKSGRDSRRMWDKLYLIGLGLFLVVLPFDESLIWPPLALMSLSASASAARIRDDASFFSLLAKITLPAIAKVAPTNEKRGPSSSIGVTLKAAARLSQKRRRRPTVPEEKTKKKKNAVEWRCVTCGRENTEPLHDETTVETVIHRVPNEEEGNDDERVFASFRKSECRPKCARCSTPIDYSVRASNRDKFLAPSGDGVRASAILRENNQRNWKRDEATAEFVRDMLSRVRDTKRRDSTKRKRSENLVLFRDWEFDRNVKKFRPTPARRRIGDGERYQVGDRVESYAHFPTWYPATVVSRNQNGSYVLRFENGEINRAIGSKLIRYRIERSYSPFQRAFSGALLVLCIVWPPWIAFLHKRLVALPLVTFAAFVLVCLLCQFAAIVARDGGGGILFLTKLVLFWCGPPLFLLVFSVLWFARAHPIIVLVSFGIFYVDATIVATAVKPVCRHLFVAAGVPLSLFGILYSLWLTGKIETFLVVYFPLYVVYFEMWWLHFNLPLLLGDSTSPTTTTTTT